MLNKKTIGAFVAAATLLSGFAFASLPPVAFASTNSNTSSQIEHKDTDVIQFKDDEFKHTVIRTLKNQNPSIISKDANDITYAEAMKVTSLKFDFYDYRSAVDISDIENFSNLKSLELDYAKLSSLEPIGKLTKLTKLTISHDIDNISNLQPLSSLKDLEELTIDNYLSTPTSVSNLFPLSGLDKLTKLRIATRSVTSLEPLKSLTRLKTLYLQDGTGANEISNITPLSTLSNLEDLSIGVTDSVTSLEPLKSLTRLKNLFIWGSGKFSDLSPLNGRDLNELRISKYTGNNLSQLKNFRNLTNLELVDENLSDVSDLQNLTNLTSLRITSYKKTDISVLSKLTKLQYLDVPGVVSNLSPLNGLKELTQLGVRGDFSDLSPLSGLTKLSYLSITSSELSDLSPLSGLTKLTYFYIDAHKVKDISVLRNFPEIDYLTILCHDNNTDYSPLNALNKLRTLNINKGAQNNTVIEGLKTKPGLEINFRGECYSCITKPAPNPPAPDPHVPNPPAPNPPAPNPPAPNPPAPVPGGNHNPDSDNKPDNGQNPDQNTDQNPYKTPTSDPSKAPKKGDDTKQNSPEFPEPSNNPQVPQNPEVPQTPQVPNSPETPEVSQNPQAPNAPHAPEVPKAPAPATKSGDDKSVNAPVNVPEAPKSVNDLKPEVKGDITVGNNNVAKAGAPNKVTLHVDNAKFNKELKDKGSVKAYAFMYSTPKLLRSVDGSDYVTVKLDANGVPYFDAQFPAGYSGKHTVVLVDEDGNQLGWTNITVENKTANGGEGTLPATGVGVAVSVIAMAVFAGIGVTLRRVR